MADILNVGQRAHFFSVIVVLFFSSLKLNYPQNSECPRLRASWRHLLGFLLEKAILGV